MSFGEIVVKHLANLFRARPDLKNQIVHAQVHERLHFLESIGAFRVPHSARRKVASFLASLDDAVGEA